MGGNSSYWLRRSGYDGLIVEGGKAEEPVYIYIKDGEPSIRPAKHLWGKTTGSSTRQLLLENGFPPDETKAGIMVIGRPARTWSDSRGGSGGAAITRDSLGEGGVWGGASWAAKC